MEDPEVPMEQVHEHIEHQAEHAGEKWVSMVALTTAILAAFAAVTSFLADSLAALLPWLSSPFAKGTVMLVILAALAVLNVRGVRDASRFNAIATVAKLLPLALLITVGAFAMRRANLSWEYAPSAGAVGRASMVLIFAFLGVEAALVPSGEVKDPARTVPRAVLIAIGFVALLYVAVQVGDNSIVLDGPGVARWDAQDGCEIFVNAAHAGGGSPVVQYARYGNQSQVVGPSGATDQAVLSAILGSPEGFAKWS